jgi:excisionase family DNA binding protein
MSMAIGPELLTTQEVADVLDVTCGRVRQFVVEGRLEPSKRIGTNLLFDPKQVREFKKTPRPMGRPKKDSE